MRTVSQMYSTYAEAARVVNALEAAGISSSDITLLSGEKGAGASGTTTGATSGNPEQGAETGAGTGATVGTVIGGGAGLLAGIGSLAIPGVGPIVAAGWLIATLTGAGIGAAAGGIVGALTGAGVSEADAKTYAEGIGKGGTLVSVRVQEAQAGRAEAILHGQGAASSGAAGYAAPGTARAAGPGAGPDETLKVVREDLVVGKRQVEQGGVRVATHMVETPVEEQVQLHDEQVRIERHRVDQPLTGDAAAAFQERVIEARATGEEVVVSKETRVVEEIVLHKEARDRTETVRDTLRETKVEVEDGAAGTTPAAKRPAGTPPKR